MTGIAMSDQDWIDRMRGAARVIVAEPIKAIRMHGQQFSVTSAAAFMSAAFSMQHDVLPVWVAVPLAIGFEWTYLNGLSTADKTLKSFWSSALNWSAMLTSIVYGVLYVLGHYGIITSKPTVYAAIWLAFAHVLPMAILSFCSANLRREHRQAILEREAAEKREQDRIANEDREYQREQHRLWVERQKSMDAQLEQARVDEEIRKMRREARRPLSTGLSTNVSSVDNPVDSVQGGLTASGTPIDTVREQLRKQIVTVIRGQKDVNKVALAKKLGISRAYLYVLINEAKDLGEFDGENTNEAI